MAKKQTTDEELLIKAAIFEKYFDEDKFDVDKATNEILSLYNIVYTPKQGFFIFNEKYWTNVEDEYIGHLITQEMLMLSKPSYSKQIIDHIKHKEYRTLDQINANRNRLVLNNGTLDLSDWNNIKFHKDKFFIDDYSTIHFDWNYDKEAKCPEFINYLNSTFKGYEENIDIIQEMFGYCLTTSVKFEKIFVLYGEGGGGKSVLIDTLKTLIGESNYSTVPMSLLSKSFLRATLKDKVLNFSTEETNGIIKDTAWIKAISSGDPIEAQFKCKDSFNFNPFCKLVYAMNDLPQIENFDKALHRRFLIIPFKNLFRGDNIDLGLKEGKLHKEMDGILQFALAGLERLAIQNKFTFSESAQQQLESYSIDSNHAERFADTYLSIGDPDQFLIIKDVYKSYCEFCKENNEKAFKNSEFTKIVKRKFGLPTEKREQKKVEGKVVDIFSGLTFRDYFKEDINDVPASLMLTNSLKNNVVKMKKPFFKKNIDISSLINEI